MNKIIKTEVGDIKIIFEDDDLMVIDKPAGLIVHEAPSHKEKSLSDYLLEYYPDLKGVGEDASRPGIVHRLDKEVSGLMLIAKNQRSYLFLKEQFKKRTIKKEYLAIVYGKMEQSEGKIEFPLVRARSGHKMAALPLLKKEKDILGNRDQGNQKALAKSRDALTLFKLEQAWPNLSLLKVEIKTGRTHQIRAHLAAYGYPLLGDNLYATAKTKVKNKKRQTERIYLASVHLAFKHPNGEKMDFEINIPEELKEALPGKKK